MSSQPLQYDFPQQLVQMAQIPGIQANAGLTSAQAAGQNITNQKDQLQLSFMQQMMDQANAAAQPGAAGPPGSPTPSSLVDGAQSQSGAATDMHPAAAPPAGAGASAPAAASTSPTDPANISNTRSRMTQTYAPVPDIWTPQELQAKQVASYQAAAGIPGATQRLEAINQMHAARIQNVNNARAAQANQDYQYATSVATAPAGTAHDVLAAVHPEDAQKAAGLSDSQLQQKAKIRAAMIHETSGMPMEYKDMGGVMTAVDKTTGVPITGYNDLHKSVTPKDIADIAKEGDAMVSSFDKNGVESKIKQYQFDGFKSNDQYVASHVGLSTYAGANVSAQNRQAARAAVATPPPQQPSAGPSPVVSAAGGNPSQPSAAAGPAAPSTPFSGGGAGSQYITAPGSKLDFSQMPDKPVAQASSPGAGINPTLVSKVDQYDKDLNTQGTGVIASREQQMQAAQQDLNKSQQAFVALQHVQTGPYAEQLLKTQAAFQQFGIKNPWFLPGLKGGDPAAMAEAQKLLTAGGLSEFEALMKAGGGASLRFGANLADIAINKGNPSILMPKEAVMGMLQAQVADSQRQVQKWGPAFAEAQARGKDMRQFGSTYDTLSQQGPEVEQRSRLLARQGLGPAEGEKGSLYSRPMFNSPADVQAANLPHGYKFKDSNGVTRAVP